MGAARGVQCGEDRCGGCWAACGIRGRVWRGESVVAAPSAGRAEGALLDLAAAAGEIGAKELEEAGAPCLRIVVAEIGTGCESAEAGIEDDLFDGFGELCGLDRGAVNRPSVAE